MSSAADPTAAFLAALQASRLLAPQQVQHLSAWAAQARPDPAALAKEVTRLGWLTPFQVREVARGRGKDLILGQYVLLDLLGEGGMGRVYRARHTRLGRDEAVKVIRQEKLKNPAAEARFDAEMRALGKVTHPNVVRAFDAGTLGDTHFVSMEFVDGSDLTKMVRDHGPLAVPFACEAVRQAALGLHHAHELGMVHRDIKPSNILASRDGRTVKLVDLGLARLDDPVGEGGNRLTQDGFVIGTPDFLAPEQARDPGSVDIRADIYALGATLFYILTGKVPFEGATPTEKLLKHHTEPPPRLLPLRPDAPPELERLIHWCMAKAPKDRPQSPLQLAAALQPFCPPPPPAAPQQPMPAMPPPPPRAGTAAAPLSLDADPPPDPAPSSQTFELPPRSNADDPIRRRAAGRFPTGLVLVGLGGLFFVAVLAFAAYRVLRPTEESAVEPFENSLGMKMVRLDGGTFRMGSPPTEPGRGADEGPVHEVTIRGPLLMSAHEVTHQQYARVMDTAPSLSVRFARSAAELPVENVTHEQAREFCKRLTDREKKEKWSRKGWEYRLPTEAEWEYACRAGTDTPFAFGPVLKYNAREKQAKFTPTDDPVEAALGGDVSTPPAEPFKVPDKVGSYHPNAFGLYDLHGNAAEWCSDWYKPGYPDGHADNPTGPESGVKRVVRGGSFRDPPSACRSAARRGVDPNYRGLPKDDPVIGAVGFRVVYAPVRGN